MRELRMKIKSVTKKLVEEYNKKFEEDERYFLADQTIIKLFDKFGENKEIEDILLKISVINDLYSTNIFATFKMAKHILALKIDSALKKGDPKIVNKIAKIEILNKQKNFYSFATKYCNWHNPLRYPMYDKHVSKILIEYKKQTNFYDFNSDDLRDYPTFLKILTKFRDYFNLKGYNFKQIDKFLWMYGKELFG